MGGTYKVMSRKEMIQWLKNFFKEYPLRHPIKYGSLTDKEVEDMYVQYKIHCSVCGINLGRN